MASSISPASAIAVSAPASPTIILTSAGSPLMGGIIGAAAVRRVNTPSASFGGSAVASLRGMITPMGFSFSGANSPTTGVYSRGKSNGQLRKDTSSNFEDAPTSPLGSGGCTVVKNNKTSESAPMSPVSKQMSFMGLPIMVPGNTHSPQKHHPADSSISNLIDADILKVKSIDLEDSETSFNFATAIATSDGSPVPIYTLLPESMVTYFSESALAKSAVKHSSSGAAGPLVDSRAPTPTAISNKVVDPNPNGHSSHGSSSSANFNFFSDTAGSSTSDKMHEGADLDDSRAVLNLTTCGQNDCSATANGSFRPTSNTDEDDILIMSAISPSTTTLPTNGRSTMLTSNGENSALQISCFDSASHNIQSINQSQVDEGTLNSASNNNPKLQIKRATNLGLTSILSASQNTPPPTVAEPLLAKPQLPAFPAMKEKSAAAAAAAKPARPPIKLREARPSDAEGIIALRDSLDMTNATSFVWDLEDMRKRIETRYPLIIIALTPDPSSNGASEVVVGVAGIDVHGMEKDFPVRSIGSRLLGVPANTDYVFPADYCMCRGLLIHQQYQGFGLGSMLNKGRLRLLASIAPNAKVILSARGCTIEETLSVVVPCMEAKGTSATPEFTKDELFEFTFSTSVGIVHMVHGKDREGWKFVAVDIADGGPVWLTSKPLAEVVSSYDVNIEVGYALHRHADPNLVPSS